MAMTKFEKNLRELNDELLQVAGKPLDSLSEKEKENVVLRWALARNAQVPKRNSIPATIIYVLIIGVFGVFLSSLLVLGLKLLLSLLGVL